MTIVIAPWVVDALRYGGAFILGWIAGYGLGWLNKQTRN